MCLFDKYSPNNSITLQYSGFFTFGSEVKYYIFYYFFFCFFQKSNFSGMSFVFSFYLVFTDQWQLHAVLSFNSSKCFIFLPSGSVLAFLLSPIDNPRLLRSKNKFFFYYIKILHSQIHQKKKKYPHKNIFYFFFSIKNQRKNFRIFFSFSLLVHYERMHICCPKFFKRVPFIS